MLEKLVKDKYSSLLRIFINYGRKKFNRIDTWACGRWRKRRRWWLRFSSVGCRVFESALLGWLRFRRRRRWCDAGCCREPENASGNAAFNSGS